jgi:hypothetical protein
MGFELYPENTGKARGEGESAALLVAVSADPDLQAVIDGWPGLAEGDRQRILEIVRASGGGALE